MLSDSNELASGSAPLLTMERENEFMRGTGKSVFDAYNNHASAPRSETKQYVLNTLREWYQDHHVTVVDAGPCSLLEFAAAGKAEVVLEASDDTFHATREWKPVGTGVEKKAHPGRLQDDYQFARCVICFLMRHLFSLHYPSLPTTPQSNTHIYTNINPQIHLQMGLPHLHHLPPRLPRPL